ncbi:Uncharacterised protein [Citrobacter koseri]|nr:Uncharacterised protein [Citrobacter koseri]STB73831.1 Uncharacterised protein [Citrobacter koseri]
MRSLTLLSLVKSSRVSFVVERQHDYSWCFLKARLMAGFSFLSVLISTIFLLARSNSLPFHSSLFTSLIYIRREILNVDAALCFL